MDEAVRLSRPGLTVPWGFRLQGGADFNQRLVVQKVTADGIASRAQIKVGDVLVKIGDVETLTLTHKQACDVIGSAKLQLELTIVRQQNAHKLWQGADRTSDSSAASTTRPQPAAAETSGQAWLPSTELRRRASSNLTSPLSPRVPRHPPWEPAPTQPVAAVTALRPDQASFPPPPPSLAPTSASGQPSFAAGPTLGAQLARLQLKAAHDDSGVVHQPKVTHQSTFTSFIPAYQSAGGAQRQAAAAAAAAASAAIPTRAAPLYGGAAGRSRDATADRPAAAGDAEARRGSAGSMQRESTSSGSSAREGGYAADAALAGGVRRPSSLEYRESSGGTGALSPSSKDSAHAVREVPTSPVSRDGPLAPGRPLLQRRDSQNSDGGGTRAYLIQPNGLVAAVQWNERPPPPDIQNSAVLAALKEEQQELNGGTARRRSSSSSKHGLSFRVLQLITGTMEDDESGEGGTGNDDNPAGSPRMTATSPLPASPTGSVFSTSPKEGFAIGARGHRRTWSTSQDDYSDF